MALDTIEKFVYGVSTFEDIFSRFSFAWSTTSHASLDPTTLVWTNTSGTIYSTPATTQPNIVVYNDTVLTLDNNTSPALNKWYWAANVLYVNVGEIPSTGILEAGKRGYVNLTGAGYHTYSYLEMRVANTTAGGIAFNNGQISIIYDHITAKYSSKYVIYQYNNSANKVTNSTLTGSSLYPYAVIYSNICAGIEISGNTISSGGNQGVLIVSSDNVTVFSNVISSNINYAIQIENSDNGDYYSNTMSNNGTGYYPSGSGGGVYLKGSSESDRIYKNTLSGNYVGIMLVATSGAGGNSVYYNTVKNSTVNGIDIQATSNTTGVYEFIYNNVVIHNPSPLNTEPYTGHAIDIQTANAYRAKIANNIIELQQTGTNCNGIAVSGGYLDVWLDYNIIYDTTGGTGHHGKLAVQYDTFEAWQTNAQANANIKGMDGVQGHAEAHSTSTNPNLVDISSDFNLQNLSPAIDVGASVGLSTDHANYPIYGTPDIGAYEYQPPFTIGTSLVDPTGNIRIYGDRKYRYTTATSSAMLANFSATPAEAWTYSATATRPEWLNVSSITWNTSGTYAKSWTVSSATATTTIYTIGDLRIGAEYDITVDDVVVDSQTADAAGEITYTYSAGYASPHTFAILDATAPTNVGVSVITANSSSQLTVTALTAIDTESALNATPYWFNETSNNAGASDSIWQTSTSFIDDGLSINTQYSYQVKARDINENESAYSSVSTKYTLAATPSNFTASTNLNSITLGVASLPNETSGLSGYYFSRSGANSGWIQTNAWTDSSLSCNTSYVYSIKYKNGDGVETDPISITQSTTACPGGGALPPPVAVGTGQISKTIDMGQIANIGILDNGGTNILAYINSGVIFQTIISNYNYKITQEHNFKIIDLDLLNNVITVQVNSETQIIKLKLAETQTIDLDNDGVKDIEIKFANIHVNRAELTMASLLNETPTATLIKYPNSPKVYLLENNLKRWIVDGEVFNALGYRWNDIKIIYADTIYTDGENLASSTNKYIFKNFLKLGQTSEEVKQLQIKLKTLGYFTYPQNTGYFGSATQTAVKAFQKANNISPLGYVGPGTRAALNK